MQLLKNSILGLSLAALAATVILGTWLTVFAEDEVFSSVEGRVPFNAGTPCTPPAGWSVYRVDTGDTLTSLANQHRVEPIVLMTMNCLDSDVTPGETIYLPPFESTGSTAPCGPPAAWVLYPLQAGDSLSRLADQFGVDEASLWHANCMDIHTTLQPGMSIYVPPGS